MACNVGQYLPDNDQPLEETERLVHLPKTGYPRGTRRRQGRGSSFTPRNRLEMSVVTCKGQELTLLAYRNKWGEIFVELHRGDEKIRSLHTHQGHSNPGHGCPMSDGHMHFPTKQYPFISNKSQYAYEVDFPFIDQWVDVVQYFGGLLDIEIDALQLQLGNGGRL